MSVLSSRGSASADLLDLLSAARLHPDQDGAVPDDTQLATVLSVATRVPDHGGLRPWRFVVVRGAGRDRFGEALVAGLESERGTGLPDAVVAKMRGKAFAAPCQVMLVASPRVGSNVPVWEQVASASCTGYAVVLGATALGLGTIWKSAPVLHTAPVRELFGAGEHEQLLGWVNIGTASDRRNRTADNRDAPELGAPVTILDGEDVRPLSSGQRPQ